MGASVPGRARPGGRARRGGARPGAEHAEKGRGRDGVRPGGRAAKGEDTRVGDEEEEEWGREMEMGAHLRVQNPAITVHRIT
jgi:hypothetical protein